MRCLQLHLQIDLQLILKNQLLPPGERGRRDGDLSMTPMFYNDPTGGFGMNQRKLSQVLINAGYDPDKVAKFAYSIADIHVDTFLAQFSIDYRIPETLIADSVMPIMKVDKASDLFAVWSRADANKVVEAAVGPRDYPAEVYQTLSSDNYKVTPRAIWSPVPNDLLIAADAPLDLLGQASRDVRGALMKSRELRVASVMTTSGNYTYTTALSGNNRWDVGPASSTADPLNDIMTYMDKASVRPNVIGMSRPVWTALRKHPRVVASVSGVAISGAVTGRVASEQEIATLLGVERVVVGDAKYRSSADGAAEVYSYIWGTACFGVYVTPGAGINQLCFAKTFRHSEMQFTSIYDQRPGMNGVTYIKGSHSDSEKVTAASAGFLLTTVIS